jgi:hypothetical protein
LSRSLPVRYRISGVMGMNEKIFLSLSCEDEHEEEEPDRVAMHLPKGYWERMGRPNVGDTVLMELRMEPK